mmetsp:Transcript_10993/g.32571  ORF Transcript_10993/g.32571 Transcript_10993/m.32571 type:complete len:215 (+) Transcript_10993:25-669(+)
MKWYCRWSSMHTSKSLKVIATSARDGRRRQAPTANALARPLPASERTTQKRKNFCARGSTFAGAQVRRSPSATTSKVSGSTLISGQALLCTMSFLPMPRQRCTASTCLLSPYFAPTPARAAAPETKARDVPPMDFAPKAPNMGRMTTGWGVGMEAFGSPICAQAMVPPLMTISGLAPKSAGFQMTRSASLPASTEPTACAMPWATAGLMVYLAT